MQTPLGYADATATCIRFLAAHLPTYGETCPIIKVVPKERPARFVQVFRTGGPRRNLVVDDAQLTISCWALTDQDAATLAALVRGLLLAIKSDVINGVTFYKVEELGGPVDLPDPESNQSRMTWSVIASVRGTDLQPAS